MRIRSFKVPFSRVLPEDAHELEFGPDDYMVVRPVFGLSAEALTELVERMQKASAKGLEVAAAEAEVKGSGAVLLAETEEDGDALYADVVAQTVLEWHLTDETGAAIPVPATRADAKSLPGALAGALYDFLTSYRGDGPNPTTRG